MAADPELDDPAVFEAKETAHALPVGWRLLAWGLVVWGAWYLWTYTPALGGWSQAGDLDAPAASTATNVLATVAFTVIPTVAAILLVLAQRRKRRA